MHNKVTFDALEKLIEAFAGIRVEYYKMEDDNEDLARFLDKFAEGITEILNIENDEIDHHCFRDVLSTLAPNSMATSYVIKKIYEDAYGEKVVFSN